MPPVPLTRRLGRYAVGSAVATAVSQAAFVALYAAGTGAGIAAAVAFLAGVPVNWWLNRTWVWTRGGRPSPRRELLPYAATVAASAALAAGGTGLAGRWIEAAALGRPATVALGWLAFAVVNGVLFVAKFAVFDRLFAGQRRDRSRHQVPRTTRA